MFLFVKNRYGATAVIYEKDSESREWKKYRYLFKNSVCKWTNAVQTCVPQGSTVYIFSFKQLLFE